MSLVFEPTAIDGVRHIRLAPMADERGSFARTWCRETFAANGLDAAMVQTSTSFNVRAGTLRGMHFAWPPATECKLVRIQEAKIRNCTGCETCMINHLKGNLDFRCILIAVLKR